MKDNRRKFVLLAGLVILGVLLFRAFGGDEKSKIRRVLEEVTVEASAGDETQGIQIQTKSIKVSRFMTPSFTAKITLANGQVHTLPSKQELVSSMTAAIYLMKPLIVEVSGLEISVSPGANSAEATLDVNLRHKSTEPPFESAHFLLELKKIDGDWLIDRAEGEISRR